MLSTEFYAEFLKTLNMKLWFLYHSDYEDELLHRCSHVINFSGQNSRMLKRNCVSLQQAIKFKYHNENVIFRDEQLDEIPDGLLVYHSALKHSLAFLDVVVQPYDDYHERFNILIKYNCSALINIIKGDFISLKTYDAVIKDTCQSLYEIVEWKITFSHREEYDKLLKTYSINLLFVLEEAIHKLSELDDEISCTLDEKKMIYEKLINAVTNFHKNVQ